MTVPSFLGERASAWDETYLGGVLLPGVSRLSGPGIKRRLDKQKEEGKAGQSLKDTGDDAAEFTIETLLYTTEQFRQLESLLSDIHPRRRGGPKFPLDLVHPAANFLGIDRVYVEAVGFPEHDKQQGTMRWAIDVTEWMPEPKPQNKAAGSGGSNANDSLKTDPGVQAVNQVVEDFSSAVGSVANTLSNAFGGLF